MARLDPLSSGARLVGAAALSLADVAGAALSGFPTRARGLSASWLTDALRARYPDIEIRGIELLDTHSGTTSRARIRIDATGPADGPKPPDTLFLKLTPHAWAQKIFLTATGIGRNEVRFYRTLRPGLDLRAPEVHGVASLPGDRQFVLLLEDLEASGVTLSDLGTRASLRDAERVIDALAILHAQLWQGATDGRVPAWVPRYESRKSALAWERFITGQMIGLCRRRYASESPPGFEAIANVCQRERDHLESLWAEGERTFIHGDTHLGNLFFDGDRVGFFDWQICAYAPGMRDVSYFLSNSLASALRAAHERTLIERYLAGLDSAGTQPPSLDTAWRQHRLFALYTWIAAAFTAAAGSSLQPREIGEAGLRRATQAAIELESVQCAMERI
jgi:aminoglycoside phosphotransferase (APT) family kinase protein